MLEFLLQMICFVLIRCYFWPQMRMTLDQLKRLIFSQTVLNLSLIWKTETVSQRESVLICSNGCIIMFKHCVGCSELICSSSNKLILKITILHFACCPCSTLGTNFTWSALPSPAFTPDYLLLLNFVIIYILTELRHRIWIMWDSNVIRVIAWQYPPKLSSLIHLF